MIALISLTEFKICKTTETGEFRIYSALTAFWTSATNDKTLIMFGVKLFSNYPFNIILAKFKALLMKFPLNIVITDYIFSKVNFRVKGGSYFV